MKDGRRHNKEHIATELQKQVLTLELAPGAALDEALLSEQFGLSRTPLREVFQKLAGEGYINLETNRGASVSSMDFDTMRAFFQCAPMVYAAIARLATEQATPSQIEKLKKIQQRFTQSVKRNAISDMAMHNHRFHEQLGVMSASPYLQPSLGRLLIDHTRMSHRFYRTEKQTSHKRVSEACDQHDQMIESITNRTAAITVDLTLQHWELSRYEIDKYVQPDPLPIDAFDIPAEVL